MTRFLTRILIAFLSLLVCGAVMLPAATAAPATTTAAIPHAGCDFPQTPDAKFSFEMTSDTSPVSIQFIDQSTTISGQPITSWKWNFGDGATSTERNPWHTYAASYTKEAVGSSLTVTTSCGKSDTTHVTFMVQCTNPDAGFTTDVSSGFAPLTVKVTGTSEHTPASVTRWSYDVTSDNGFTGSAVSSNADQKFILQNPGNYTITQKVTKDCNINTDTYHKDIRVGSPQLFYLITTTTATPATTTAATTTVTSATTPVITTGTTQPVTLTTVPVSAAATVSPGTIPATLPGGTTATVSSAPVSPGTGALSVITNPPGAQIYIDDVLWGAGPAAIPNLATGAHSLRLEMTGYQNLSVPVVITEGKTAEYSLTLVPLAAGSSSNGILPLIIAAIIVLLLVVVGGYLYMQKKKAP